MRSSHAGRNLPLRQPCLLAGRNQFLQESIVESLMFGRQEEPASFSPWTHFLLPASARRLRGKESSSSSLHSAPLSLSLSLIRDS